MKDMRIIIAFVFSILIFQTVYGQTGIKVPNGIVYNVTIRDDSFHFDHADYFVFIPDGVENIQGVFIHQHGCTVEGRGAATAYDVQYQVFVKKWNLAVIDPDLYPKPGASCRDWRDPVDDGSGPALLLAVENIADFSCHQELTTVPWLLWGHSGGGYWVLNMLKTYPEQIIAAVAYSPAFNPQYSYLEKVKKIPVLIRHAGAGDCNSLGIACWETVLNSFSKIRYM